MKILTCHISHKTEVTGSFCYRDDWLDLEGKYQINSVWRWMGLVLARPLGQGKVGCVSRLVSSDSDSDWKSQTCGDIPSNTISVTRYVMNTARTMHSFTPIFLGGSFHFLFICWKMVERGLSFAKAGSSHIGLLGKKIIVSRRTMDERRLVMSFWLANWVMLGFMVS